MKKSKLTLSIAVLLLLSLCGTSTARVIPSIRSISFNEFRCYFTKVSERGVEPWSANYEVYIKFRGVTVWYTHGSFRGGELSEGEDTGRSISYYPPRTIGYDEILVLIWVNSHDGTVRWPFNRTF